MKCFFTFLFVAVVVLASAQDAKDDYDSFLSDYDTFYDYDQLKAEGDKIEAELDNLDDNDLKVKAEIEKFREEIQNYDDDKDEALDNIDDYQFEDNRDKPKDKDIPVDKAADAIDDDAEKKKKEDQADYALLWGDDSVAPLPVPDTELSNDQDILEETQKILKEDGDNFEDMIIKSLEEAEENLDNEPNKEIIEETQKILEDTGDSFNDDEIKTDEKAIDETKKIEKENVESDKAEDIDSQIVAEEETEPKPIEDINVEKAAEVIPTEHKVENIDEQDQDKDTKADENAPDAVDDVIPDDDTVDKVYADLHEDLDKLLETLDKLSDDGTAGDEKLEEVYDKLDEHFFKDDDNIDEELVEDTKNSADYNDIDLDKILEDIFNEDDVKVDDAANVDDVAEIDLKVKLEDEMNEPNPDDAFEGDVEPLPDVNDEPILLPFLDAIVDEPKDESIETNKDAKIVEPKEIESIKTNKDSVKIDASVEVVEEPIKSTEADKQVTVDVQNLNSAELEGLVQQFAKENSDVLDTHSKTFQRDTAPVHITLKVDEPVEITSPNYPSAYPTNNIVDWIFDGEGVGIEMNITDFTVNGALGDYLLVKPGGVDESGHEGLLFTYRLNSEKRFLFSDVDRMFMRFEARPGMWNLLRGFRMTVKMISPIPEDPEPMPEPEPVLQAPHSVHTVYLATAIPQFHSINETFRLLIADMAEEYIVDNGIERGVNTTEEVTQITAVSVCPITWPRFELCAAVTFGVSLEDGAEGMLDEEALEDMWSTYSRRDPYALRLRKMGIAEFDQPSTSVLTAWLVIASGVVISMAMMTFVFWRFSCFKDYTRMNTYSDTDSLRDEKRGLDLYPTPHQDLPPLYAESQYQWQHHEDTARVDIGGFANKSYARDMYDFDSDEDVIPPRDSFRNSAGVTAGDIYKGSVA